MSFIHPFHAVIVLGIKQGRICGGSQDIDMVRATEELESWASAIQRNEDMTSLKTGRREHHSTVLHDSMRAIRTIFSYEWAANESSAERSEDERSPDESLTSRIHDG
ncbi:hypothetical protein HETIRDRAFT_101254 [Heterobasidion irregulare TC 32-1]|uniref:Uncharacterized protein n=1 Tax=Heterobasidion irregulare (strain TC 32-1) TaxID=747525 RepID=W4K8Z5_HETIT|nr:uncharacterized protein HETIRDRAFT_101254 [Heterobasidion irregulare TC 32-1]ETW82287.1 hypothetical protein HETIRDRAFT_101254 [Heterobasidion irregulare TC 32-1]